MSRSKIKFYAVVSGLVPGIYDEWYGDDGAEAQVNGFPNARYQGFSTRKEAKAWLREFHQAQPSLFEQAEVQTPKPAKKAAKEPKGKSPDIKINAQKEIKKGKVIIYTDGGCIGNPGPGGYGTVLLYGDKRRELSGGYRLTTNNRMELMACIEGLKTLKYPCQVNLFSDSRYVVNGIKKGWARRWRKKGWMRNLIEPAENADLWEQLLELCELHNVEFSWVKGHAGNPENERCDQLASKAAVKKKKLLRDTAYETGQTIYAGRTTSFSSEVDLKHMGKR